MAKAKSTGSNKGTGTGERVRELAEILDSTGLTEIELEENGLKIRVARIANTQYVSAPAAAPVAAAAPAGAAPAPAASAPASPESHPGAVNSPMVGTAYLAAEPGAEPFVKVGDRVQAGQTILIVEAMKVMNPIHAPKGGTVTQILVSDAQPVEFGEALMIIE